jgi:hypothetical protein
LGDNAFRGDALDDPDAELLGAAGQGHGEVDRVDPPIAGHIEAREQVVGLGQRELLGDLARADLVDLQALSALERGDPAVFVQSARVGGGLDEPDRLEPGGQAGLGLQPGVEIAAVEPDRRRGVRRRAETRHQPGRVPGRAGGEPVALQDDDVGPAQVGQVVGDRRADDSPADDDDAGPGGQVGGPGRFHRCSSAHPRNLSLCSVGSTRC